MAFRIAVTRRPVGERLGHPYGLSNCLARKFSAYFFLYISSEWSCTRSYFSLFSRNNGCLTAILFNLEVMPSLALRPWLPEIKVTKTDYLM